MINGSINKTCIECLLHARHVQTIYVGFHLIKSHEIYGIGINPFIDDEWIYRNVKSLG